MGLFGFWSKKSSGGSPSSSIFRQLLDDVHALQSDFINGDYRHPHQDFDKFSNAFSKLSQLYSANKGLFTSHEQQVFNQFFEVFGTMAKGNPFNFAQGQMYYAKHTYPDFNQVINHLFNNILKILNSHI